MDNAQLILGFGVPVLTLITGLIAATIAKRDRRKQLAADVALLKELPEDAESRTDLLVSVDMRIKRLSYESATYYPWFYWGRSRMRGNTGYRMIYEAWVIVVIFFALQQLVSWLMTRFYPNSAVKPHFSFEILLTAAYIGLNWFIAILVLLMLLGMLAVGIATIIGSILKRIRARAQRRKAAEQSEKTTPVAESNR